MGIYFIAGTVSEYSFALLRVRKRDQGKREISILVGPMIEQLRKLLGVFKPPSGCFFALLALILGAVSIIGAWSLGAGPNAAPGSNTVNASADLPAPTPTPEATPTPADALPLRREDILWNNPSELPYGKATKLSATIAGASVDAAIERLRENVGPIRRSTAMFAPRVKATLEGDTGMVDIKPLDDATKSPNERKNTTWNWNVTPRTTEPITLDLTLYNVDANGYEFDGPPPFKTTFTVQSSWKDWIVYQATQLHPIYSLVVGAFGLIGGLLVWRRKLFADDAGGQQKSKPARKGGKR